MGWLERFKDGEEDKTHMCLMRRSNDEDVIISKSYSLCPEMQREYDNVLYDPQCLISNNLLVKRTTFKIKN